MPHNRFNEAILYVLGYRDAMGIGECYELGRHVTQNLDIALKFYRQAAQAGSADAYFKIGAIYQKKYAFEQAAKAYFASAIRGNANARQQLNALATRGANSASECYWGLFQEHEKNWLEAQRWYTQAATSTKGRPAYPRAMYQLGQLYEADRHSSQPQRHPVSNHNTFQKRHLGISQGVALKPQVVISRDIVQALRWYRQAAVAYSKQGLNALVEKASENGEAAFHLAQMYELGEGGLARNLVRAVDYYRQASKLGHAEAAFRLGQLYDTGEEEIPLDKLKASQHYLIAAQHHHAEAFRALQRLVMELPGSRLSYAVGEIYQKTNEPLIASRWYKQAADRGDTKAVARLHELASAKANVAYAIGQSYEEGTPSDRAQAFIYYAMALRNQHEEAKTRFEALAQAGKADAQYALGYEYYYLRKDMPAAVNWCLKAADQQHPQALRFLTDTTFDADIYWMIADKYERGEGITKNRSRAVEFYAKAGRLGHKAAAFRLGQLQQLDIDGVRKNPDKACQSYLQAVKNGHPEALIPIERLGEEAKASTQVALGHLCLSQAVNDKATAAKWYRLAAESGDLKAQQALATFERSIHSSTSSSKPMVFSATRKTVNSRLRSTVGQPSATTATPEELQTLLVALTRYST